jgi:patatin-like phospholipase/acyl hydrolase
MKKILSIDGGGIRGIIPGQILIHLEKKLQTKTGNPDARIAEYFDFFAGTSTGGILVCILLCPDERNPAKPKFSAQEAVDLYVKNGDQIFDVSLWQKFQSGNGILDEKYDATAIEGCLNKYFSNLKLSELLKPCIVTSYDVDRRNAHFFAQHDYATKGDQADFYVKDVCRATSAAPTYFETSLVKSQTDVSYALVDGGVFANNPALCAYSEVRNSGDNPTAKDMYIVSLGTGSQNKSYKYETAKDWGAVGWIKPVIDIMMAGASETTDYHLKKMFSAGHNERNYVRIQPSSLHNADPAMDNASANNIKALIEVGIETAQNCPEINDVLAVLLEGPDPVIFKA